MVPAPDPMGAPSSLTARRPNASNLPTFELPPPPLAGLQQKYPGYSPLSSTHSAPTATTLTSVGNLLTPPSNASADGLSPSSSGIPTTASLPHHSSVQPFTPGSSGMWQTSTTASTPYGFQSASTPNSFTQGRGLFSPSLNSIVRGTHSPAASEGLPPPPYEMPQYSASMPMSGSGQQQMMSNGMMGSQSGHVSHASPVHSHADSYTRLPPTPTYYGASQQASAPQQASYPYSTGPSPMQHSPISSGPLSKMSPLSHQGSIPPLQAQPQQYSQQRPYNYSMSGPVLSNAHNPGGQLALVGGGLPHGMVSPFGSGAAAHIHHLYGHHHHHQQSNPQNDRPFRCDQCPQSFNRNHDLKRHKRIHLAVKPFPCGHCDKSFSRKDALKRHVLVKGCGKAQSTTEVKELEGSSSPEPHSESAGTSPVVSSTV